MSLPNNNYTENTIYESEEENYDNLMRKRSNSEINFNNNPNYRIEKKIETEINNKLEGRVNKKIYDFQNLGNLNKTEKEDLLPKNSYTQI